MISNPRNTNEDKIVLFEFWKSVKEPVIIDGLTIELENIEPVFIAINYNGSRWLACFLTRN